jgi:hypothetical protein
MRNWYGSDTFLFFMGNPNEPALRSQKSYFPALGRGWGLRGVQNLGKPGNSMRYSYKPRNNQVYNYPGFLRRNNA